MWRVKIKGASPLGTNTFWLNPLHKCHEWIIGPLSYFCPAETSLFFFLGGGFVVLLVFFFLLKCLLYSGEKNKARSRSLACSGNEEGCSKMGCTIRAIFECTTLCEGFLSLSTLGLTDNSHGTQSWGEDKQQEWQRLLHWRWPLPSTFGGKTLFRLHLLDFIFKSICS